MAGYTPGGPPTSGTKNHNPFSPMNALSVKAAETWWRGGATQANCLGQVPAHRKRSAYSRLAAGCHPRDLTYAQRRRLKRDQYYRNRIGGVDTSSADERVWSGGDSKSSCDAPAILSNEDDFPGPFQGDEFVPMPPPDASRRGAALAQARSWDGESIDDLVLVGQCYPVEGAGGDDGTHVYCPPAGDTDAFNPITGAGPVQHDANVVVQLEASLRSAQQLIHAQNITISSLTGVLLTLGYAVSTDGYIPIRQCGPAEQTSPEVREPVVEDDCDAYQPSALLNEGPVLDKLVEVPDDLLFQHSWRSEIAEAVTPLAQISHDCLRESSKFILNMFDDDFAKIDVASPCDDLEELDSYHEKHPIAFAPFSGGISALGLDNLLILAKAVFGLQMFRIHRMLYSMRNLLSDVEHDFADTLFGEDNTFVGLQRLADAPDHSQHRLATGRRAAMTQVKHIDAFLALIEDLPKPRGMILTEQAP